MTLTSVSSEAKFELQRYFGGILPRLGTLEQRNNEPLKKFQNFGIQKRLTCSSANQRLQILKAFTPEIRPSQTRPKKIPKSAETMVLICSRTAQSFITARKDPEGSPKKF